jgi:hypothetical protein
MENCNGYLFKRGGGISPWKKRFFSFGDIHTLESLYSFYKKKVQLNPSHSDYEKINGPFFRTLAASVKNNASEENNDLRRRKFLLSYYPLSNKSELRGIIDFSLVSEIKEDVKNNQLILVTPMKSFYLRLPNKEEYDIWLNGFKEALSLLKNETLESEAENEIYISLVSGETFKSLEKKCLKKITKEEIKVVVEDAEIPQCTANGLDDPQDNKTDCGTNVEIFEDNGRVSVEVENNSDINLDQKRDLQSGTECAEEESLLSEEEKLKSGMGLVKENGILDDLKA